MDFYKEWEQSQLDDFNLQNAKKSLDLASKQNQDLAQESRQIYDKFYDKILLYSAGAFSFSVALVGLVVADRIAALSKIGLFLPNVYWMYLSLGGYLITCSLVLLAKRFDAAYVAQFGMHLYCEKKKKEQEAFLDKFENYPGEVLVTEGGTREEEIEKCKENITKLTYGVTLNSTKRDRSYKLKRICHVTSEISVVVATTLLLLFTIQLTQAMIWG